jgi:hypothetical protein
VTLREVLQAVYERNGALTPEIVVEEARDGTDAVSQYLHDRLTWDNDDAAERWRLEEAQRLIQRAKVTYKPAEGNDLGSVRAFWAVPRENGRSYEPIEEIAADPVKSKIVLADAERAWRDLMARYGHLEEFLALVQADLREQASARRKAARKSSRRKAVAA